MSQKYRHIKSFSWFVQHLSPWCPAVTPDSFLGKPVSTTYGATTARLEQYIKAERICRLKVWQQRSLVGAWRLIRQQALTAPAGGDGHTGSVRLRPDSDPSFSLRAHSASSFLPGCLLAKANPPTATTTKIVLSDSIGNAASAGLGSCLQDYNMICEHVNTSWIKQCSLHASQQRSPMERPSVWEAAWIRESEEHNFSLWTTVSLSLFQLNQIQSIFKA